MNLRNTFPFLLLLLLIFGVGCTTPWNGPNGYAVERQPPKAITEDIQRYIQEKKIPATVISEVLYGVAPTGRREVRILQEIPASLGKETLVHVLHYNAQQMRTKVRILHARRVC